MLLVLELVLQMPPILKFCCPAADPRSSVILSLGQLQKLAELGVDVLKIAVLYCNFDLFDVGVVGAILGGIAGAFISREKNATTETVGTGVGAAGGYVVGSPYYWVIRPHVPIDGREFRRWFAAKHGNQLTVQDFLEVASYVDTDYVLVDLSKAAYLVIPTSRGGLGFITEPKQRTEIQPGHIYIRWQFVHNGIERTPECGAGDMSSSIVPTETPGGALRRRSKRADAAAPD
jgi:hypothetical protein